MSTTRFCVLDTRSSSREALRVLSNAPGTVGFEIPLAAVERSSPRAVLISPVLHLP
jgi:hypothetical protein